MTARGFTLIEVLIAITVASLVLVLISQTQRLGLRAVARQTSLRHEGADLRAAAASIREVLAHMDPGTRARPFSPLASQTRIVLRTRLPAAARRDGLAGAGGAVTAELVVSGKTLLLRFQEPEAAPIVLARDVAGLELSYRGGDGPDIWRSTWAIEGNPRLVRARIIPADPGHAPWPAIIVAPLRLAPVD